MNRSVGPGFVVVDFALLGDLPLRHQPSRALADPIEETLTRLGRAPLPPSLVKTGVDADWVRDQGSDGLSGLWKLGG